VTTRLPLKFVIEPPSGAGSAIALASVEN